MHDMALRDRVGEELVHVDEEELQGDEVGSESEGSEEEDQCRQIVKTALAEVIVYVFVWSNLSVQCFVAYEVHCYTLL